MTNNHSSQILLARQPIFDAQKSIVAYELLFRNTLADSSQANVDDGDLATSQVIWHTFSDIGFDIVTDKKQAFINFTRRWILNPPDLLNKDVVIEILEDVEVDQELVSALIQLKQQGYQLALDDYQPDKKWRDVLPIVHIVKLDITQFLDENELAKVIQDLRQLDVKLVVEKVETLEQFNHCQALGADLFQGYFLCKPQIIQGNTLAPNRRVVAKLIAEINSPEVELSDLELTISKDPALCVGILKLINSAAFGLDHEITSIRHGISLLGLAQIQSWANVIALSRLNDKTDALMLTSLIRAYFGENLGKCAQILQPDICFTLGLFSTLDAYMDMPMEELIQQLPLSKDLINAFSTYQGELGNLLTVILSHEKGDWGSHYWEKAEQLDVSTEDIESAYLDALSKAKKAMEAVSN